MNIDVTGMKSRVPWGCQKEENPSATMSMNLSSALLKNKRKYRTKLSCSNTCQGSRTVFNVLLFVLWRRLQ